MSTERDVTREVQLLDAIDLQLIAQKGIEDAEQQEQLVAIARYALTLTEELKKLIEAEEASYDAPAVSREFLAAVKALLSSPAGRPTESQRRIRIRTSGPET